MKIHRCARRGDIEGIKACLAEGTEVDARERFCNRTPLMFAVLSPFAGLDCVRFLVEQGADPRAVGGPGWSQCAQETVLELAAEAADPAKVEFLLNLGLDVHESERGSSWLIMNAVYAERPRPGDFSTRLVKLLIDRGVTLDIRSPHVRSCTNMGAAPWCDLRPLLWLLAAGADPDHLLWSELHWAVAMGTVEDLRRLVEGGASQSARDWWERTPWLLGVQLGEIEKTRVLLELGANRQDTCGAGTPPTSLAAQTDKLDMLRWLVEIGFDFEAQSDHGDTALIESVKHNSLQCAEFLLKSGAKLAPPGAPSYRLPLIREASSLEMVRLLVEAGEELSDLCNEMRAELTGLECEGDIEATVAEYREGSDPRFGLSNPQKMDVPFWNAMVRSGVNAYRARDNFGDDDRSYGRPVWCFERFGKSITPLPDGRIIEIGGEHEDYGDSDFYIYHDVIVHHGPDNFEIYCYPEDVFPPTDFHSATLVGDYIYIIGTIGNLGFRQVGFTPVYRLHIESLAIEKVETSGDNPGWISRHKARLMNDSGIRITGGKVVTGEGAQGYQDNEAAFILDLKTLKWQREPTLNTTL